MSLRRVLQVLVGALLALIASAPLLAQSPNTDTYFYTPGGGGVNGALGMCLNTSSKAVPCNAANVQPSPVSLTPYPINSVTGVQATPVTASTLGTTNSTTATLPGVAGKTTYICGFSIRANANAAITANSTVTGTISGTLSFMQFTQLNTAGIGITEPPLGPLCIPANGVNTAINVVSAAPGTGGLISVSAWGYQL
jgi:hypothetical protein